MKSLFHRCRKPALAAAAFLVIGLAGTMPAHAQFFFGGNFIFSCGPVNQPLGPVFLGNLRRWIVPNMTTTVLTETGANGLRKVQHTLNLRAFNDVGNQLWSQGFNVKSNGIAQVIQQVPGWQFGTVFQPESTEAPFFPFASECLGFGPVVDGNDTYLGLAMGTFAAQGTQSQGEDLAHMNFWVLTAGSGQVVNVWRPRPVAGRYLLQGSGFFDIDNDGDTELVLVYGIYFGGNRYDFVYDVYDIGTGQRDTRNRFNQRNVENIQ